MRKTPANKNRPPHLRFKVSAPFANMALGSGVIFRLVGIGLAALSLFGPLDNRNDFTALRYPLGPCMCLAVPALVWTLHPFRPYRGSPWAGNRTDIGTNDPVAMRLVEIYRSRAAKRFLWRGALKLSCILFAILGLAAILLRKPLSWALLSPWLPLGLVMGTVGCSIALTSEYCAWGLRTWVGCASPQV